MVIFSHFGNVLRLSRNSDRYAPKFLASHYGEKVRNVLRKVETVQRKILKREADTQFLRKCLMYHLTPIFARFKLHKEGANSSRRARTFRHQLISAETDRQQKSLKVLRRSESHWKSILFQQILWLTQIYVSKFLQKQAKDDREKFSATHKRKLQNLGLHISSDELDVVVNLSYKKLTPIEHQALNHGLQFGILPTRFNFIDVQTEFENLPYLLVLPPDLD